MNFASSRFLNLIFATVVWVFMSGVSGGYSQNLLTNSGFETGNNTGWTTWGSTLTATNAVKRSGVYSGKITNRTANWQTAVVNALPLVTSGKTYRFSAWLRLEAGADSPITLWVVTKDGSGSNPIYTSLNSASGRAGEWTQLSGEFRFAPTGQATQLDIYFQCADPTRILYVDDAELVVSENVLVNGDLERGNTDSWSGAGGTIVVNSSEKHSGSYSGYVSGRNDNWHGTWINNLQNVLTSGKTYKISMWVKPAGSAAIKMQLTTKQTNVVNGTPKDDYGPFLQERTCAPGEWSELSGGFKYVNNNTSGLSVYLYCNDDKTSSYYVDDAKIVIDEVTVDLAAQGSPITQKATGFLHGLGDTVPSTSHYESLKPRIQRFPAFLGSPNMLGAPSGFSSAAYMNRLKAVGAKQEILMSDEYMWFGHHNSWGWPGDAAHAGKTSYQILDEKIDNSLDYALANFPVASGWQLEWDIWNEPDNADFWKRSQAQFFETWKHAHQRVRAKDPNAVIKGPSIAYFVTQGANPIRAGWLKAFLLYARDNNVLPDIVSWHEMVNPKEIPDQVQMIRAFMAANAISSRPIDVNEYQGPGDNLMLSPGNTVQFLSQLESTDIRYAIRACWNEDAAQTDGTTNGLFPGRLDNIMTMAPFQPRAVWHVYNSYAGMTGNKVFVSQGGFLNGFGAVNNSAGTAKILVGNDGTQAFTTKLTINNLSQLADFSTSGKVRVRVREIPYSGLNALGAPTEISNSILTAAAGTLEVPLNVTSRGAYEITLETGTPKVLSITPVNGAGTSQVQYRVVFDRPVTGFNSSSAVTIAGSGASASFGSITAESTTSYLLNLINVTGSGSLTVTVQGVSFTSAASAEPILVDNFSFENALGGNETANWANTTWAPYPYTAPTLAPTNGTQIAYSNSGGGTLAQILDGYSLVTGDQVTLRVDVGYPAPNTWGGATVSVTSVNGPGGTVAMGTFTAVQPPANGWNTLTMPMTVTAPQAGGNLRIVITHAGGGVQTVVDNVRAEVIRSAAGLPGINSSPSPVVFTLQTASGGNGTVSRTPNSAAYGSGTIVQLTPVASEGYKLGSWSGGASGSANPLNVTITAATSVTGNFVTNPAVYGGWSIEKLGSIHSMTADSDADGASNLVEYALAMNPTAPDPSNLPTASLAPNGHLQLIYRQNVQATDLTYVVQSSTGLASWAALVNSTVEDLGTTNNVQTLRVTDASDPGTKGFLRLHITRS